jgi:hypothetical protein
VLNAKYVSKPAKKLLHKFEVRLVSLFDIMVLCNPCNLNISSMKS